jgi:hypothetical protein
MPLNTSDTMSLLRVHDCAYGPPSDRIDVEVVIQFVGRPADAFGFQLRDDANGPARQGMLDLLRDAFNHGWRAWIDYDIQPGKKNGTIIRTWVTLPHLRDLPPYATSRLVSLAALLHWACSHVRRSVPGQSGTTSSSGTSLAIWKAESRSTRTRAWRASVARLIPHGASS